MNSGGDESHEGHDELECTNRGPTNINKTDLVPKVGPDHQLRTRT